MKRESQKSAKPRIPKYARPLTYCPYCGCPIPITIEYCSKTCQVWDKTPPPPRLEGETLDDYLEFLCSIRPLPPAEDDEKPSP